MSLINKMLRDLDARRAPAADRPSLPTGVYAAQRRPERNWLPVGLGVGAVAVAAGAAWFWLSGSPRMPAPQIAPALQTAPVPQVVPAVVSTAPAPVQPQSPAAPAPAVAQMVSQLPAAQPQVAAPPQPASAPRAPLATTAPAGVPLRPAAQPPLVKAPAIAAAQPAVGMPAKPAPAKPPVGAPAAAAGKAVPAPAAEGSIEKRPHGALANEAAENEYNKAIAALRRGANTEAIASLQSALRLDATHVSARQALLSLMVRNQRWADAQAVAAEGLSVDPSQTGWAIALARLQAENGKLAEASDTLARNARYAERNADYQAFSAVLMQKQKRFAEASERYRAALALRGNESRWWYGLGVSLESDQKPQEARAAFLRAREIGNLPPELAAGVERHLR